MVCSELNVFCCRNSYFVRYRLLYYFNVHLHQNDGDTNNAITNGKHVDTRSPKSTTDSAAPSKSSTSSPPGRSFTFTPTHAALALTNNNSPAVPAVAAPSTTSQQQVSLDTVQEINSMISSVLTMKLQSSRKHRKQTVK